MRREGLTGASRRNIGAWHRERDRKSHDFDDREHERCGGGFLADAAFGACSGGLGVARNFAEEAVAQAVLDLPGADGRKVIRVTTEELAQRVDLGGWRGP
ncbi:hypothetical protein [Nannocystis bainbridge]|uniref:Uncharacterized protein n=1 Tax=Nannocystis bainbridge TaxID=2995303 RepID=A0ABT5DVC5_9BACT|nr:hypothetical protein [Nannocystis bainbridge]MDC0717581.1 hypothetical protein [Nannocystis bainbridge]